MIKIMQETVRNEGVFAFYKGVGPPLATVPLVNSIVFASYEFCKDMMGVKSQADFTIN